MRYVSARYKKEMREEIYRIYVTDAIQGVFTGILGGEMPRYYDLFDTFGQAPEKTPEDAKEIVNRIREKLKQ